MALFDGLIEEILNYLQTSSVLSDMDFTAEYPLNTKPHPLKRIHVSIGLRSVKAENAAFGEYLGMSGQGEIYGKKIAVSLRANIYTPKSFGGNGCFEAFSRICDSLFLQNAQRLGITGISCGTVSYHRDAGAFLLDVDIQLATYVGQQVDDALMGDIVVRGEAYEREE